MEILLQYLDDLDDLVGAVRLCAERIRSVLLFTASSILCLAATLVGVMLALLDPPLALAVVIILSIQLLYRRVRAPGLGYAN